MNQLKAIAAMSLNHVIGAGSKIPWHRWLAFAETNANIPSV
jgi:dihydrofolate reductase